jgi:osmotically inducible protein OsmC
MALAERTARSVWKGDLMKGGGNVSFGTGAIADQPVSWPARTESPDGKTSPEELIAGAAASCWSMAFSHALHQKGHKSEQIDVTATVSLDKVEGGVRITRLHLAARGRVPGMDAAEFERLAKAQACPVTNALKDNVDISISAVLEA